MTTGSLAPMRVVAGAAGGLRLVAPRSGDVRPTSERVREAIFAALGSLGALSDARVLDLFAGSGALGIEALSRGARHVTFVDSQRAAVVAIRANLASTGLDGGGRARVVRAGAASFVAGEPGGWDLVLADPPYGFAEWPSVLERLECGLMVAESDRPVELGTAWEVIRSRAYGGTVVVFARKPQGADEMTGGS